jgi:hypothetical protein
MAGAAVDRDRRQRLPADFSAPSLTIPQAPRLRTDRGYLFPSIAIATPPWGQGLRPVEIRAGVRAKARAKAFLTLPALYLFLACRCLDGGRRRSHLYHLGITRRRALFLTRLLIPAQIVWGRTRRMLQPRTRIHTPASDGVEMAQSAGRIRTVTGRICSAARLRASRNHLANTGAVPYASRSA